MSDIAVSDAPSTRSGLQKRTTSRVHHRSTTQIDHIAEQAADSVEYRSIRPSKHTPRPFQRLRQSIHYGGPLRPCRLLLQDLRNLSQRWCSDWLVFNQLILASAVYVFFTNLLPGITFASDLFVLTGKNWGTIEVGQYCQSRRLTVFGIFEVTDAPLSTVLSTGVCGVVFAV